MDTPNKQVGPVTEFSVAAVTVAKSEIIKITGNFVCVRTFYLHTKTLGYKCLKISHQLLCTAELPTTLFMRYGVCKCYVINYSWHCLPLTVPPVLTSTRLVAMHQLMHISNAQMLNPQPCLL